MQPGRRSSDLVALLVLALLGLVAVLAGIDGFVGAVLLLPLAFAVPGYALAAALFPPGQIPASERAVYVIALGIAAAALSGILVQLVFSLDRMAWALTLSGLTLAAGAVAAARRWEDKPTWTADELNPVAVVLLAMALAMAAWAVANATNRARDELGDAHFTELWLLPTAGSAPGAPRRVSIGVSNHEGHTASYQVNLTLGGVPLRNWTVRLGEGQAWTTNLPAPRPTDSKPLRVTLLRDGRVFRNAFLRSDSIS